MTTPRTRLSPSVLCIDADPAILSLRKQHLEGKGYTVLQAESGTAGLALLATRHVDCVVVNYNMPGTNGDAVAHAIQKLRPEIPVLFVSSGTTPEDVVQWVDGILAKGSLPSALLRRIEFLFLHSNRLPFRGGVSEM